MHAGCPDPEEVQAAARMQLLKPASQSRGAALPAHSHPGHQLLLTGHVGVHDTAHQG